MNAPLQETGDLITGPAGLSPHAAVHLEEILLNDVQSGSRRCVMRIWRNDWCAVLGRNNKESEWINEDALAADGVPVIRRDSGGGTVIHHPGNLNYTFIVRREIAGISSPTSAIPYFLKIVERALAYLDVEAEHRGVSDVFAKGHKISGNAERIKSRAILHHGTILMQSELERMQRYLKIPPNRPGIPHKGFVAGLWELGFPVGFGRMSGALARAFSETTGISLFPSAVSQEVIAQISEHFVNSAV